VIWHFVYRLATFFGPLATRFSNAKPYIIIYCDSLIGRSATRRTHIVYIFLDLANTSDDPFDAEMTLVKRAGCLRLQIVRTGGIKRSGLSLARAPRPRA
jgi:hypothetical protein